MKRKMLLAIALVVFAFAAVGFAQDCATIQTGAIYNSYNEVITPGYDDWGYNYVANMFNGGYCDAYRGAAWCLPYADVELIMKWNDAWLSNKDCNNDGKLDRHFGYPTYRGSGAWLTNHQSGQVSVNGRMRKWTYFVKIVAAPLDAQLVGGYWYTAESIIIGPSIWGEFAVIEQISNDPSAGEHGILYKSPAGPGFGQYGPQ